MKFAYTTGARPLEGYTIKRGVGVGGFGEVYFATSDAGKEVALKRVQRNLDVELRGVGQCLNLKHPNLVALYDIKYDDQGQAWVVMEYIAGECLKEVIDRNPSGLPRDEVRKWFAGIAAGTAYLHDHGIVHRDLKPGNLFLDEGIVKIGDYGLTKFISCSRRSGQTESVGTFHYMAPEIGRGSYGREIDIYALGIVLFEMLTGRVPFEGESSQEIIMKHLTADPDVSGLEEPFASVITKAMRKDPEARYRDVGAMVAALGWGPQSSWDPSTWRSNGAAAASAEPGGATVATAPEVLEIADDPPAPTREEPLYIGDDPPHAEGIELGEVRVQPPRNNGRWQRPGGAAASMAPPQVAPVRARPMVTAATVIEPEGPQEPIAAAVGRTFRQFNGWWNESHLGLPMKVALLLAIGVALVFNASWLVPLAMGAGILYVVYFGIWSVVQAWQEPEDSVDTGALALSPVQINNRFRPRRWQEAARERLKRRAPAEKVAELIGSMLMAALAAVVLSVVMMIIGARPLDGSIESAAFFSWFAITSTLGTWMVLVTGKVMETRRAEPVRRRFAMLIVGLLLGAIAFGLQALLMVSVTNGMEFPSVTQATSAYGPQQTPLLPAYLAYFAGVFVVLRWWRQVDPLRPVRLSLWATGLCVLWGAVLELFWHFPQPWGLMLVATISVAAQLSSGWLTPTQRAELRREVSFASLRH